MASAQARGSSGARSRPALAPVEEVDVATDRRGEAGQAGRHCLQERVAHPLGHAWQDEGVGRAEVVGRVFHPTREVDPVEDSEGFRLRRQAFSLLPFADEDQRRPGSSGDGWPRFEKQVEVLLGMEPAGEDDPGARVERGIDPKVGRAGRGSDPRRRRWPSGPSSTEGHRGQATGVRCRPRSPRRPCFGGSRDGGAGNPRVRASSSASP